MTLEHKLRVAVSHLIGEARLAEMVRLMADREALTKALQIKFSRLQKG